MVKPASTSPETTAIQQCKHCGDDCLSESVALEGFTFCCQGCATVYQILSENKLLDFYTLDQAAGAKQKHHQEQYDWLNLPELAERFIRYKDDHCVKVSIELPDIHCLSCVWLLENLSSIHSGIISCEVNYARKQATIFFAPEKISLAELAQLLAKIGYPPKFEQASKAKTSYNKGLYLRLGLAGFAFGNIMLFSFPEYFNLGADVSSGFLGDIIGYLLLGLSIPVLFYSGSYYLNGAFQGLKRGYISFDVPIALGMLALFSRSAYEVVSGIGPGYFDSLAGLIFFLLIGRWFQSITFNRLNFERDYEDYFPIAAYKVDESEQVVPIATADIQAGTTFLVRPGQLIPADGTLLNEEQVDVNYSFVTGEAEPQAISKGQQLYAGGRAVEQALKIMATAKAQDSYLLQLWQDTDAEQGSENDLFSEKLSKYFTLAIVSIALATFVFWYWTDEQYAFQAAIAVLIIACPCALALAKPFAYGTMMRLFAHKGLYLRSTHVLDRLKEVDEYVFDKTGTLLDSQSDGVQLINKKQDDIDAGIFLSMAMQSEHPKSQQIVRAFKQQNTTPLSIGLIKEHIGQGISLLQNDTTYTIGSATFCGLAKHAKGTYLVKNGQLCYHLKNDNSHFRPGVENMLLQLDNDHKHLLSGDQKPALERWQSYFDKDKLFFDQSPFDKKRYLSTISDKGGKSVMVGDGLNDTGALQTAHVGIAVAENIADFSPACDGILIADKLSNLPKSINTAKRLPNILAISYMLAFIYNIIGLSFAVTGKLSPVVAAILMPASSISVVLLAVGLTTLAHRKSHKNDIYHRN